MVTPRLIVPAFVQNWKWKLKIINQNKNETLKYRNLPGYLIGILYVYLYFCSFRTTIFSYLTQYKPCKIDYWKYRIDESAIYQVNNKIWIKILLFFIWFQIFYFDNFKMLLKQSLAIKFRIHFRPDLQVSICDPGQGYESN